MEVDDQLRRFVESLSTPATVNESLAVALMDTSLMKLAARALQGEFSDFDSPHATPKIELVRAIDAAPYGDGYPGKTARMTLIERVKTGEFDG